MFLLGLYVLAWIVILIALAPPCFDRAVAKELLGPGDQFVLPVLDLVGLDIILLGKLSQHMFAPGAASATFALKAGE